MSETKLWNQLQKTRDKIAALKEEETALKEKLYNAIPAGERHSGILHTVSQSSSISYKRAIDAFRKQIPQQYNAILDDVIAKNTSHRETHRLTYSDKIE